jgi:hypothetical protein
LAWKANIHRHIRQRILRGFSPITDTRDPRRSSTLRLLAAVSGIKIGNIPQTEFLFRLRDEIPAAERRFALHDG